MTRKRARAAAGPFDTYAYWLMPHGLRGLMTTIFWPTAAGPRPRATARARRVGPRSPVPGPLRPFAILAPGKMDREVGQHTFWRGSLWGRTVALQGDSSFTKYDLFEVTGPGLLYWGDASCEVVAHYDSWRDPDSQIRYEDVLEVHYWGRYPEPTSREVYHLGKGLGTIRFESKNCEDFLVLPAQGGAVSDYLRGWSGSIDAVITTDGGDEGTSPWKIALRGTTGGGDGDADFVISSDYIPVTPGKRYRLSGSLWRVSAADNVYLDFNDGAGLQRVD